MFKKTKAYIKCAPWPHASSFMFLVFAADNAARTVDYFAQGNTGEGIERIIISVGSVLAAGCLQILSVEYYDLYKRLVADLENGWDERIITPMMDEWCTKHIAKCATSDAGYKKEYKGFKKKLDKKK